MGSRHIDSILWSQAAGYSTCVALSLAAFKKSLENIACCHVSSDYVENSFIYNLLSYVIILNILSTSLKCILSRKLTRKWQYSPETRSFALTIIIFLFPQDIIICGNIEKNVCHIYQVSVTMVQNSRLLSRKHFMMLRRFALYVIFKNCDLSI
jgi:hypothetical protein